MAGVFRVINVRSHELEKFGNEKKVKYAILSHRWQDEEVDFQQMQDPLQRAKLKGYEKIRLLCEQALRDGYNYAWVRPSVTSPSTRACLLQPFAMSPNTQFRSSIADRLRPSIGR